MNSVFFMVLGLVVVAIGILIMFLARKSSEALLKLESHLCSFDQGFEKIERSMRDEISRNREELSSGAKQTRDELASSLKSFSDNVSGHVRAVGDLQKSQLDTFSSQLVYLTQMNEQKMAEVRNTVESRLKSLQEENSQKLEKMRETVDEKLHSTLEKRLGESFKLVSERLEMVHKGLGEMQSLATGVGDLKKVLANVKVRGTLGEIQLGNLLEQILTPDQYAKNVATKEGSRDNVEFAVKLPGKDEDAVWLPIDAKFPMEDYQRLLEAQEQGNASLEQELSKNLENRIKQEAKDIRDKYLDPPHTTDFAILFLPIEGLYAEVLRIPGLYEFLQREYRVSVTGPSTISAFLSSLHMGFRTLAIEKRASEVWNLLGTVKTEFGKFGDILDKTQKKLQEASNTIEDAAQRSRVIERKLKDVQGIPASGSASQIKEIKDEEI
ncbi:MAG: DNA recombination protein RmuC [Candidatus Omnitrophica bacterium]|nr:DNA recombination protein RmuC [Candidatus Omnitrophota bacterium]